MLFYLGMVIFIGYDHFYVLTILDNLYFLDGLITLIFLFFKYYQIKIVIFIYELFISIFKKSLIFLD